MLTRRTTFKALAALLAAPFAGWGKKKPEPLWVSWDGKTRSFDMGAPVTSMISHNDVLYVVTSKGTYAITGQLSASPTIQKIPRLPFHPLRFTPEEA